jgi:hypothetical protein
MTRVAKSGSPLARLRFFIVEEIDHKRIAFSMMGLKHVDHVWNVLFIPQRSSVFWVCEVQLLLLARRLSDFETHLSVVGLSDPLPMAHKTMALTTAPTQRFPRRHPQGKYEPLASVMRNVLDGFRTAMRKFQAIANMNRSDLMH